MNMPTPTLGPAWDTLVQRARGDTPAPVNESALLAAVRLAHQETAAPAPVGLLLELSQFLGTTRMAVACTTGAAAFGLAAAWTVWTLVDQLYPWAQLVSLAIGGVA